jgi:hypothetical protein
MMVYTQQYPVVYSQSSNTTSPLPSETHLELEVSQIRLYRYDANSTSRDYHFGEEPLPSNDVNAGSPMVINALIKNWNHTGEHFDYVTEVLDSQGIVIHLDVRYFVAVPLSGQIGIDGLNPIILDNPGTYTIKIFTVAHLDDNPFPPSTGRAKSISVVETQQ